MADTVLVRSDLEERREAEAELAASLGDRVASVEAGELGNLLQLADALLSAARVRTESRGAHSREEYPAADPTWRMRLVHQVGRDG